MHLNPTDVLLLDTQERGFFVAEFIVLWRVLGHEKARFQIVLLAALCVQPLGMRRKAGSAFLRDR